MKRRGFLLVLLLFAVLQITSCEEEKSAGETSTDTTEMVVIGTDESTGLSHVTGLSIAEVAGKRMEQLGLPLSVKQTDGPVASLNALRAGDLAFAVVSSDALYEATRGLGPWTDQGPQTDLLAVFTVHAVSVSLLAADDAGIRTIEDLKGRRVNIGAPGSAERRHAIHALENAGINLETDLEINEIETSEASRMLQEGEIDAFFSMTEHPNAAIKSATSGNRKVRFVPITGVEGLLLKVPYYVRTKISVNLYPGAGNREDVETIGYKLSLCTSANASNKLVTGILAAVFDNIEDLKELHPAYQSLAKNELTEGMFRMIHPGAKHYYAKNGYRLSCCF